MKRFLLIFTFIFVNSLASCADYQPNSASGNLTLTVVEKTPTKIESPTETMENFSGLTTPTLPGNVNEATSTPNNEDGLLNQLRGTLVFTGNINNVQLFILDISCISEGQCQLQEVPWQGNINLDPDISFDGKKLVFSSDKETNHGVLELYRYDIATGKHIRLTFSPEIERNPQWSPDGNKIVYESHSEISGNLRIIEEDGCCEIVISEHERELINPTWSPDGRRIAYLQRLPGGGSATLYLYDINNKKSIQISENSNATTLQPLWSPDGGIVAYIPIHTSGQNICFVYIDSLIEDCFSGPAWHYSLFAWHPSEEKVFLTITDQDTRLVHNFGFYDTDKKSFQQITYFDYRITNPVLSPDGEYIVFNVENERYKQPLLMVLENNKVYVPIETDFGLIVEDIGIPD